MSNLDIPPEEWLKRLFSDENCLECGEDENGHTAIDFGGNWLAVCKAPNLPTSKEKRDEEDIWIDEPMNSEREHELKKAFIDLLDGQHSHYEIREQTGLPERRCKEIEKLYLDLVRQEKRKEQ